MPPLPGLFNIFYFVCVCVYAMCVGPVEANRGVRSPWSWSCKWLATEPSFCWGDDKHHRRLTLVKTPCCLDVCPEQLRRSSKASKEEDSCFGLGWSAEGWGWPSKR